MFALIFPIFTILLKLRVILLFAGKSVDPSTGDDDNKTGGTI